jgi:integrase/recombinase XerC
VTSFDGQISDYLDHLAGGRRCSPHTLAAYRRDLARLRRFCLDRNIDAAGAVTPPVARQFTARLRQRGLSPRSIQRVLSAARGLYRYLVREGRTAGNPFDGVRAPKQRRTLPRVLDPDQVTALVEMAADDRLDARDRAMLELFYSSGLRLAELAALDVGDVERDAGLVRVAGKGGRTRVVPVGRHALVALDHWLAKRTELARDGEQAVFLGRHGGRLGRRSIERRVALRARRAGLPARVHPHMLRHSFASHLLQSSGDLRAVQEMLGHANIGTTQIYTHLDFQQLAAVYDRCHPRARQRS